MSDTGNAGRQTDLHKILSVSVHIGGIIETVSFADDDLDNMEHLNCVENCLQLSKFRDEHSKFGKCDVTHSGVAVQLHGPCDRFERPFT